MSAQVEQQASATLDVQTEALPYDSLATLNEDGGMTLFLMGPVVVIAVAIAVIAIVRVVQRQREVAEMKSSLRE